MGEELIKCYDKIAEGEAKRVPMWSRSRNTRTQTTYRHCVISRRASCGLPRGRVYHLEAHVRYIAGSKCNGVYIGSRHRGNVFWDVPRTFTNTNILIFHASKLLDTSFLLLLDVYFDFDKKLIVQLPSLLKHSFQQQNQMCVCMEGAGSWGVVGTVV